MGAAWKRVGADLESAKAEGRSSQILLLINQILLLRWRASQVGERRASTGRIIRAYCWGTNVGTFAQILLLRIVQEKDWVRRNYAALLKRGA
jgi:hypothetical protein